MAIDHSDEQVRNRCLARLLQRYFPDTDHLVRSEVLGGGRIHDTYLVHCHGQQRLVMQRLNGTVFPDPVGVAGNVALVGEFLQRKSRPPGTAFRVLRTLTTPDGSPCVVEPDGAVWRVLEHIDARPVPAALIGGQQAFEIGRILGTFHEMLRDFEATRLGQTLPGFHDLPGYCRAFDHHLRTSPLRRTGDLLTCCKQVERRLVDVTILAQAQLRGDLVERVVHGDPKGDNVLFDRQGKRALALIDLDTVSSGLLCVDLGDCLRSLCNPAGERPADRNRVGFDLALCRRFLEGYRASAAVLSVAEQHYLFQGVRLLTFELGVRFLTDHLAGNRYFKINHPEDNLQRAAAQFALLEDIELKQAAIETLVDKLWSQ